MISKISLMLMVLLAAFAAQAGTISFYSGDGLNERNLHNSVFGANVLINPDPVWMSAFAGSRWVSYADTGNPGTVVAPNTDLNHPTAQFFEDLPAGTFYLTVNVLADDTAGVFLVDNAHPFGLLLKAPNPNQDNHCAAGTIGCEVGENWWGSTSVDPSGTAKLRFDLYQRGGGPTGLDYNGTASSVPEPASLALLGGGLLALGGIRKFRSRHN